MYTHPARGTAQTAQPANPQSPTTHAEIRDAGTASKNSPAVTLAGLAFPLIVVKYHGPTSTRGGRYIATLRRYEGMTDGTRTLARLSEGVDPSRESSEQRAELAAACWNSYRAGSDSDSEQRDGTPRALIPVDMWDGATGYVVVPTAHLAAVTR